jgi:hypothetical protein
MAAATRLDWVCIRRSAWRGDRPWFGLLFGMLTSLSRVTPRVAVQRWVRFRLHPADVPLPEEGIRLTPVTEEVLAVLRAHPDFAEEAFATGLAFWDFGVRNGYVWFEDGQPRCFQWQLSAADTAALRERSPWGNMYPPLEAGMAHQEKMWTFSSSRMKGVASRFALAMFDEARRAGVTTIIAHINETNEAALALVNRTGWKPYGKIQRFNFHFPVLRTFDVTVAVHLQ